MLANKREVTHALPSLQHCRSKKCASQPVQNPRMRSMQIPQNPELSSKSIHMHTRRFATLSKMTCCPASCSSLSKHAAAGHATRRRALSACCSCSPPHILKSDGQRSGYSLKACRSRAALCIDPLHVCLSIYLTYAEALEKGGVKSRAHVSLTRDTIHSAHIVPVHSHIHAHCTCALAHTCTLYLCTRTYMQKHDFMLNAALCSWR